MTGEARHITAGHVSVTHQGWLAIANYRRDQGCPLPGQQQNVLIKPHQHQHRIRVFSAEHHDHILHGLSQGLSWDELEPTTLTECMAHSSRDGLLGSAGGSR
jgi:hypothetical protein